MSGFLTSSGWWLTKVVGTYKKYGFHERKRTLRSFSTWGVGTPLSWFFLLSIVYMQMRTYTKELLIMQNKE